MMSSSSSSQNSRAKYDVFISFRGTEVRSDFLSHLKKELQQKHLRFYVDDVKLMSGEEISPALLTAIDESLISLVIFSKDYASSKWCLEELVKIMECKEKNHQIVIPVFYKVEPSDVRHQIGSYEDAFTKHYKRYNKKKVQIWRSALINAANLSGICSSNYKNEAELVEKVANSLSTWLYIMYPPSELRNLVGIQKKIEKLQSLMQQNSQEVCVIGLWGMGGIGKTTLATALFNRFCSEYEGSSFLENIKDEFQKAGGVIDLKKKLFSSLLKEEDLNIQTSSGIPLHVERKLGQTKVLVVLDDINDSIQLEKLVGKLDYFKPGSRIIITTRDNNVLNNCVAKGVVIKTYKVEPLASKEALELFILNAFEENCTDTEWLALSRRVIEYAREHPLAIKVLGSFLRGKNKQQWESQLEKLKKMPFRKIHDVLKMSYDTLDRQQKDIFLFIACHIKRCPHWEIINALDVFSDDITIELIVLRDKALISSTSKNSIVMHDLIEEMGKEIVREESMHDIGKYRHLWNYNDICEVLTDDKGTEYIQSIILTKKIGGSDLLLSPRVFSRMCKLKILKLNLYNNKYSALPEGLEYLPDELRVLHWKWYPLEYLPLTCPRNLVELVMPYSKLQKLWDGEVSLENLKSINLYGSQNLVELPNLSSAKNLQEVTLQLCESLTRLPSNLVDLTSLKYLNIFCCKKIQSLPQLPPSVIKLRASNCTSLKTVHFPLVDGIPFNRNLACIWFKNCKNLDTHSRSSIELIVLHNLTSYAHKSKEERKIKGEVIWPGENVPEWFNHRTQGGLVTIYPDSKLLGFIFCIIIHPSEKEMIDWVLRINNNMDADDETDCYEFYDDFTYETYSQHHHVCIFYQDCRDSINEKIEESKCRYQNTKLSFEILQNEKERLEMFGMYPIYVKEEDNHDEEEEDEEEEEEDEDEDEDNEESQKEEARMRTRVRRTRTRILKKLCDLFHL